MIYIPKKKSEPLEMTPKEWLSYLNSQHSITTNKLYMVRDNYRNKLLSYIAISVFIFTVISLLDTYDMIPKDYVLIVLGLIIGLVSLTIIFGKLSKNYTTIDLINIDRRYDTL